MSLSYKQYFFLWLNVAYLCHPLPLAFIIYSLYIVTRYFDVYWRNGWKCFQLASCFIGLDFIGFSLIYFRCCWKLSEYYCQLLKRQYYFLSEYFVVRYCCECMNLWMSSSNAKEVKPYYHWILFGVGLLCCAWLVSPLTKFICLLFCF